MAKKIKTRHTTLENCNRVFDVIKQLIRDGVYPSVRTIMERTGIKSTSNVWYILDVLEKRLGKISKPEGNRSGLYVIGSITLFPDDLILAPDEVLEWLKPYMKGKEVVNEEG